MAYKIIATDMDDTLLDEDLKISEENMKALAYAHSKGVKIVLATGRTTDSLLPYAKQLPFYCEEDFFVSYNGAVAGRTDGSVLFKHVHRDPVYSKLIALGRQYDVDIQAYLDGQLIVERYTDLTREYEAMCGIPATVLNCLESTGESLKILYNSRNVDLLETMKSHIEKAYKDEVTVFFSKPTYLEVLPGNASKGTALAEIAQLLKVEAKDIIAIGDSQNDLSMIRFAGLGACVSNGRDSIKEAADYVTENDHNHDAVAEVIYKFIR